MNRQYKDEKMKMLPFFPTPYPDELLYSVFARYHLRSANDSFRATLIDLFGSPSACAVVGLPVRLAALAARLTSSTMFSIIQIIRDCTLFPLYRQFLTQERAEKVIKQMSDPDLGSGIHNTIGQMASRVPAVSALRYCTKCIEEDSQEFGEPYWHRTHQVFGVRLCHRHGKWLVDSPVKAGTLGMKHAFIALEPRQSEGDLHDGEMRHLSHDEWMAAEVSWLLNDSHDYPTLGLETLRLRYRYYLGQMGLTSARGNIFCRELMSRFTEFYPEEFLKDVRCPLAAASAENWLLDLIRKPRGVSHPLHHLLLIRFIGLDVKQFLMDEVQPAHPFGRCPWPCLNRAAPHFRKAVIKCCTITRNSETGAPVGTFACSCGFIYSRTGPDHTREDRVHFSRIVVFGPVWEDRLKHLVADGKSLRETSRQLEVDTMTVIRHLARLRDNISAVPDITKEGEERNAYRARWLELCASYPGIGVKALRRQAPAHYAWLYRHDQAWLLEHPPRLKKEITSAPHRDWAQRDEELSTKVTDAVEAIRQRAKPAVRVSVSAIGKEMGALALVQRNLHKLPLTKAKVEAVLETREDFGVRRLKAAVERFRHQGESLKEWELLRAAGIREEVADMIVSEIAAATGIEP
jgi:hypothetical protein